jgi:hypothetical protein
VNPPPDAERPQTPAEKRAALVARLVAEAPPLSAHQRQVIAAAFAGHQIPIRRREPDRAA